MALDRLTNIPSAITAGSNLRLDLDITNLPASDGGSIALYFRGPGDIPATNLSYGTDGDSFTVDALASVTTAWKAGIYEYTIKHTDDAGIVDVAGSGRIEILDDPANQSKLDVRTFTEIFLSRLQELASELARNPYKTIQLGDTIYSSQNLVELNNLIIEYEGKLVREQLAEQNKQGKNTQFDVSVRFTD